MNRIYTTFFGVLALTLLSLSASAGEQFAEVGAYNDAGQVKLFVDRFQTQFPNGIQVSELGLRISNGFVHVLRKGYDAEQACRTELIELTDKDGRAVAQGVRKAAGTPVFIRSISVTNIAACLDDGCHALRNVVLEGDPPLLKAACERSELSGNKCRCHINDGSGERLINGGDFCKTFLDEVLYSVIHWVNLENVVSI